MPTKAFRDLNGPQIFTHLGYSEHVHTSQASVITGQMCHHCCSELIAQFVTTHNTLHVLDYHWQGFIQRGGGGGGGPWNSPPPPPHPQATIFPPEILKLSMVINYCMFWTITGRVSYRGGGGGGPGIPPPPTPSHNFSPRNLEIEYGY